MALGRYLKRRQYFVSKWLVNLHLTFIFIVFIDVVTCTNIHVVDVYKDRIFFLFGALRPAKHMRR